MLDLQRTMDARLASLQAQLDDRAQQVSDLTAALDAARRSVAARDAEIARLGAAGAAAPGAERLALERRVGASDDIVLALNKQVQGRACGGLPFGLATRRWCRGC
jgi:uncharacterized protein YlxW (UPF0749 family)